PNKGVRVNTDQESIVANVFAAGEITFIGGCDAALAEGEIAGHRAAGGKCESPQLRKAVRMQAVFNHFAGRLEAAHGIRKGWTKWLEQDTLDRKSTRLNSSHVSNSYAVFCLKKKIK